MRQRETRAGRGAASRGGALGGGPSGGSGGGSGGRGGKGAAGQAPSQRQLRAGELVRHALAEILREVAIDDPAVDGVPITVSEVRMSPDLRHATAFAQPLGGEHSDEVVSALNRAARFLRGELGRRIDLKFTPDLHFRHDESFDTAAHMDALFNKPEVRRDLDAPEAEGGEPGDEGDKD